MSWLANSLAGFGAERRSATAIDLRNFGMLLGGAIAALFGLLVPWLRHGRTPVWPWVVASSLAAAAMLLPRLLRYPYFVWTAIGEALGWINSQIILNLIFVLIFTPAAFVARRAKWDPMKQGFAPGQASYRIPVAPSRATDMEKPY
jgi:hypothetical protein